MSARLKRERQLAIERYLRGEDPKSIYTSLGRSKFWFFKWFNRYDPDDSVWFHDGSRRPHFHPAQIPSDIEDAILSIRDELVSKVLFYGAQAIRWEMEERQIKPLPSIPTISRTLKRHDRVLKSKERYQPKGKEYPALAADRPNQTHQADLYGPFYIGRSKRFYSLNVVDLATGRSGIEALTGKDSQNIINGLWNIWHRLGTPVNLQVDNEASFYGSRRHPRGMGALIRLCLHNQIQPWFIPPAEPWRNGVVEKFNHHYRQKFLQKVRITSLDELKEQSLIFEQRHNNSYRYSKLNGKTPMMALNLMNTKLVFPDNGASPTHPIAKPETGIYNLVRFIRNDLILDLFGDRMNVSPELEHQYVVASIDVKEQKMKLHMHRKLIRTFNYKMR